MVKSGGRVGIFYVRDDTNGLGSEVARLLPTEARSARKRLDGENRSGSRAPGVRTTFCPGCGGPKLLKSRVCRDCRDAYQHAGVVAARKANPKARVYGRRGLGETIERNIVKNQQRNDQQHGVELRSNWRTRGEGHARPQPVRELRPYIACAICRVAGQPCEAHR